jgi:hypothetical protein
MRTLAALLDRQQWRPRRLCLFVSYATVVASVSSFYVYYSRHSATTRSMALDLLVPFEHSSITHAGDQSTSPSTTTGVADEVNAGSLLHPEQHIFRPPTTIRLTWNVTLEQQSPDGVMRPVYLINGEWLRPKRLVRLDTFSCCPTSSHLHQLASSCIKI